MTGAPAHPFDPGLQPERTLLAWRRTALAMAVASVVVVRFTISEVGAVAVALGSLGALLAIAVAGIAHLRYGAVHAELWGSGTLPRAGVLVALLSVTVFGIGTMAAAWVLARRPA